MSKKILGWSLVNAFGTLLYITFVIGIMSSAETGFLKMNHWIGPVAMLLLFVMSAAITSALVFGRPIWWYLEGNKKEAVMLFVGTVAWLAVFFSTIILSLMLWPEPKIYMTPPRACTEEAKICPNGSAVGRTGPKCEFAPCPK
ncbi:MAG: hypothetical protein WCT40_02285 [Candidatus Magasanikbacteria bacterium]